MLTGLSIRNVVLIDALDLDLASGFSALTGETGAGKSIILDSLGMATGARSDRGLIRAGASKAQVSASFALPPRHAAFSILSDAEIDAPVSEDLVLRRTVGADGRSRAFINDAPVSVKLLSAVGRSVLEIHGQHDGRGLMDTSTHLGLLDSFARHDDVLARCEAAYTELKVAKDRLLRLTESQAQAASDQEFLHFAIAELDRLAPVTGEDDALSAERRFLQNAEGAINELNAAKDALGEDGEFESRLARAVSGMERVRAKIGEGDTPMHRALGSAIGALEKALLETEEARRSVSEAAHAFDIEPGRLNIVEERLFALRAASRKYDRPVDELTDLRAEFAAQLDLIDNADAEIAKAQKQLSTAQALYDEVATALTASRTAAAARLDKAILKELPPLKMDKARFETRLSPVPDGRFGRDSALFHVATNPGTALGPLDKIASGGEMSRLALAIKVALSDDTGAVLIFDEVDQGVGGAVADAVGKRLSRLSKNAQVLVVTHSPQVAASANHQFLISKSSAGDTTTTSVTPVRAQDREEEIARMLAGESVTDAARAAARQLMAS